MASISDVTTASVTDAKALTQLVFAAAPALLADLFGDGNSERAKAFLGSCFAQPHGQFGFANHRVIHCDGQAVGSVCGWHDQLPANFDAVTVTHIHEYFGLAKSIEILARNRAISHWIKPPEPNQYVIGHLCIAPECRRRGFAQQLLTDCANAARQLNKQLLVLDVETTNHAAIQCYSSYGFQALPAADNSPYVRFEMPVAIA